MKETVLMRTALIFAGDTVNDALLATDLQQMRLKALQAAHRLLEGLQQTCVKPGAEHGRCANPACCRPVTDTAPEREGFCSTMCREGFNGRLIRSQRTMASFEAMSQRAIQAPEEAL